MDEFQSARQILPAPGAGGEDRACHNGILTMKWPSGSGGFITDKVKVAADGLAYRGENQNGLLITGKFVNEKN